MKWASAVSLEADTAAAVAEVVASVSRGLGGLTADLAVLFVSPHHLAVAEVIAAAVSSELDKAVLIGCSGGGVVGGGREGRGPSGHGAECRIAAGRFCSAARSSDGRCAADAFGRGVAR